MEPPTRVDCYEDTVVGMRECKSKWGHWNYGNDIILNMLEIPMNMLDGSSLMVDWTKSKL